MSELKQLKILHVVYSFGIGGSESVAREVAVNLQRRGHENMVVALEHDGPLSAEFNKLGIRTWVVDRANKTTLGAMAEIKKCCLDFKPDVIHTHHFYILFYTVYGALKARTPVVHTEHEYWSLNTKKGKFFLPLLSRFCGKITAVNEDTLHFMAQRLSIKEDKLITILNGIDLKRFNPETELSRGDIGLDENHKVAGIVARLEAVKNHEMLLNAWRLVVRKIPDAVLLVIGEGSLEKDLKKFAEEFKISNNVLFLGPRRDIHDLLPLMDLAVLSSRNEGLPMFLLEAMACGLPVVATQVGGIPKLIIDGKHGHLAPNDNPEAFAEAVIKIFSNPEYYRKMGYDNIGVVKGTYDLDTVVDQYVSLYNDLLQ